MDFDAPAIAALQLEVVKPIWYAWLDILGDPVRATTGPANVLFPPSVNDPDLKSQTFMAYNPDLVSVSEIHDQVGGAGQVTASLSGLVVNDNALLNLIANPANWQGRVARFWVGIRDQSNVQQGAVVPYYGGRLSSIEIRGAPTSQTIDCVIESFIASWSRGSGRTYMDQQSFDPADLSAAAALAAANGTKAGLQDTHGHHSHSGGWASHGGHKNLGGGMSGIGRII